MSVGRSQAAIDDAKLAYVNWVSGMPGYTELKPEEIPRGECGASELAMHCDIVGTKIDRVWVNANRTYAYVMLTNGRTVDGSWTAHKSGDWSVS